MDDDRYKRMCADFDTRYCYNECRHFCVCPVREEADAEAVADKVLRDMRSDVLRKSSEGNREEM